ncbi:MAG: OmpA family protein [Myxococcales bacterium]|nr:OmpA family protein [Myxococcales bacterium]
MIWTRALLPTSVLIALAVSGAEVHAEGPAPEGDSKGDAGASGGVSIGGKVDSAGEAEGDASADGDGKYGSAQRREPEQKKGKWGVEDQDKKPLFRYAPERNTWEIGLFGGLFFPHVDHDFYHPDTAPQQPLWLMNADIGVRAAYMPLSFLGIEAEFSAMPTAVRNVDNTFAFLYGFRGHALLQAPGTRIAPFLLGGYGAIGVASGGARGVGSDLDPVGHLGVGLKVFLNRYIALRVDGRQYIGAEKAEQGDTTSHWAVNFGISFTLGRKKKTVGDMDKDGFNDDVDVCPMAPGIAPDGCPARDLDGDGLFDHEDQCPCDPGPAPTGCPTDKDQDGDGFLDAVDKCPLEPGIAPDGCPVRDTDGDGFPDDKDTCPTEAEVRNGYLDGDGCPDVLPKEIEKFQGAIDGITFDFRKATIRTTSEATLNEAAEVLNRFTEIRVRIDGHTDNVGTVEFNQKLSEDRAEAVKQYLVGKGVDAKRITTKGFGPGQPRDTNDTEAGRARNRRIEFTIVTQ